MPPEPGQFRYAFRFGARADPDGGALCAGRDFHLDEATLTKRLSACPPARMSDLIRIAMAVYVADRLSQRNWMSGIRGPYRHISISVQTSQPYFWSGEPILGLIRWIAEFLSDDTWDLRFIPLPASDSSTRQGSLDFGEPPIVCLYSGGLDSAAGLAGRLRELDRQIVAVTAQHQAAVHGSRVAQQLDILRARYGADIYAMGVRTALKNPRGCRHRNSPSGAGPSCSAQWVEQLQVRWAPRR